MSQIDYEIYFYFKLKKSVGINLVLLQKVRKQGTLEILTFRLKVESLLLAYYYVQPTESVPK